MSKPRSCILASGNKGKLVEFAGALEPYNIQLVPQSEYGVGEADETAVTFVENALLKARHASLATGLPALADDSGLVVPALAGAPGIYSARFALLKRNTIADSEAPLKNWSLPDSGELPEQQKPSDLANIERLLDELKHCTGDQRAARFVCLLIYIEHADDPEPIVAAGHWSGLITESIESEGGFGYDPVFYCPKTEMTAAAMGKLKKGAIGHRGLAIKNLQQQLQQRL